MKAQDFLRKGADLLEERGKQYDQPGGERSMGKAVSAFNTITGRSLSEAEGWLLLQILKDVRQWQNPDKYHADSAEDCVSYAALKAESLKAEQFLRDGWTDETIKAASFKSQMPADFGQQYMVTPTEKIAREVSSGGIHADPYDDFGAPLPLEPSEEFEVVEISHPSLGTLTYLDGELVHTEEPAASIDDDSARMQAIGQNGNTGEHYDDAPSWDDAPMDAKFLAQDESGTWFWFEGIPNPTLDNEWYALDSDYEFAQDGKPNPNWRNTLQARPTKEAI